jgi:membrane-bound metal-dependent hydrolase YbcI (DUF457 family)
MPFPVAHGTIAAGLLIATQSRISLPDDWRLLLFCAALAILPDADFIVEWVFNQRGWHRGITHSLAFGLLIGLLSSLVVPRQELRKCAGILFASVSHAPLDALVARKAPGVQLLWPVSTSRHRLGLIDYFSFNFNPRIDPWNDILIHFLKVSLLESLVVIPLLAILLLVRRT